ncbi:calcium-binding mitochondrial carrier protein SCaMC-2-like [Anastrepha ludens]|uniref:calcium-binding mitochondrial carrier protein SCaMC-2-like n=1 Tax=Anastrepha ludens TaxID=28586 RepID=UPI0023B1BE5D|nr:calcium-binding mitochondrial carrier protein SCaMC-2-like [Anastrepha ludens]
MHRISGKSNNCLFKHPTIAENLQIPDEFAKQQKQEGAWWRHSISGGFAGAISRTCTAPVDRIKLYMQVQNQKTSIYDGVSYLIREGGVRSMWRGNGVNVLKISSDSAIKFTIYEKLKHYIRTERDSRQGEMSIGERFVAGALAGTISQSAVYPFDVMKTRLALHEPHQYRGLIGAVKKIYLTEGILSFYNGYAINVIGVIPYAGIDLAVYETLKKHLKCEKANQSHSLNLLLCGTISSILGQVITYPCSLIRTRIQAQVILRDIPRTGLSRRPVNRKTSYQLFRTIIVNEGLTGLYRGLFLNLVKVVPAVCISYIVYEYSIRTLGVTMS